VAGLERQRGINTNLGSLFNMTRQVIESMRERKFGRIINISSINGQLLQQSADTGQTNLHRSWCRAVLERRGRGSAADSRHAFSSCAQPSPRGGRCATVGRQGWMKAAGAFLGRPRELRTRHNMAHNIGGIERLASLATF